MSLPNAEQRTREKRAKMKRDSFNEASPDIKRRLRYIYARRKEERGALIPTLSVPGEEGQEDLANSLLNDRTGTIFDDFTNEFFGTGITFLDKLPFVPELWMLPDVLTSIKRRQKTLDHLPLDSLERGCLEQNLIEQDFKQPIGLSSDRAATIAALGVASNGSGGRDPLYTLVDSAVAQAYLQIARVNIDRLRVFLENELKKPFSVGAGGGYGSDGLEFRIWCRRTLSVVKEMIEEKEAKLDSSFYIQRIGASSAEESSIFQREEKQFSFDVATSKWISNDKTCMIFRGLSLADLVDGYLVRIVGVAPLGDKKNGYRLEAAMCLHFRACALFGSNSANITMGGPHDPVRYWPKPGWHSGQFESCRSVDVVKAMINEIGVHTLNTSDANTSLNLVAGFNSRFAANCREIVVSVSNGCFSDLNVKSWNAKGRECFPLSASNGGVGGVSLSLLGVFYSLLGETIRQRTTTVFEYLTKSYEADSQAKASISQKLEQLLQNLGHSEEITKKIAFSLVNEKSIKDREKLKKILEIKQGTLIENTNPTSFSLPIGGISDHVIMLGWPTSKQGASSLNGNGLVSPTLAMLVATYATAAQNGKIFTNSDQPSAMAILHDATQLEDLSTPADEKRALAIAQIEKWFQQGPLICDWIFSHFGDGPSTPCGKAPSVESVKECGEVMTQALVEGRYGLRFMQVYSNDASDCVLQAFADKATVKLGDEIVNVRNVEATDLLKEEIDLLIKSDAASTQAVEKLKMNIVVLTCQGMETTAFLLVTRMFHPSVTYRDISQRHIDTRGASDVFFWIYRLYEWLVPALERKWRGEGVLSPSETAFRDEIIRDNNVEYIKTSLYVCLCQRWGYNQGGLSGGSNDPRVRACNARLLVAKASNDETKIKIAEKALKEAEARRDDVRAKKSVGAALTRKEPAGSLIHHLELRRRGDVESSIIVSLHNTSFAKIPDVQIHKLLVHTRKTDSKYAVLRSFLSRHLHPSFTLQNNGKWISTHKALVDSNIDVVDQWTSIYAGQLDYSLDPRKAQKAKRRRELNRAKVTATENVNDSLPVVVEKEKEESAADAKVLKKARIALLEKIVPQKTPAQIERAERKEKKKADAAVAEEKKKVNEAFFQEERKRFYEYQEKERLAKGK